MFFITFCSESFFECNSLLILKYYHTGVRQVNHKNDLFKTLYVFTMNILSEEQRDEIQTFITIILPAFSYYRLYICYWLTFIRF